LLLEILAEPLWYVESCWSSEHPETARFAYTQASYAHLEDLRLLIYIPEMKENSPSELEQHLEHSGPEKPKQHSKEEEEPVFIAEESLTCPILTKIVRAFAYAKASCYSEEDGDLMPGSKVIKGAMRLFCSSEIY